MPFCMHISSPNPGAHVARQDCHVMVPSLVVKPTDDYAGFLGRWTVMMGPDILFEQSTQALLKNFSQPGVRWLFGKMFDKILQIGKFPLVHGSEFNSVIIFDSLYLFAWQFHAKIIH